MQVSPREEFAQECLQRARGEAHREKPQFRALARSRPLHEVVLAVLERLGEQDPGALLGARRVRSGNRDLAVYVLYQLGVYRNEEVRRVFGVGYTALMAAVKRGRKYLKESFRFEMMLI